MIYFFLAEGFEEIEALCPLDLLRRAGLEVKTVGVGSDVICGSHGIAVRADMRDDEFCDESPELVFLPGGMPGTLNLAKSDTVIGAIDSALACGAYIAAICAAPMILGERGLLRGKEAICYPGFEDKLIGAKISENRLAVDGRIITAAGMGVSLELGLKLVELLVGKDRSDELRKAVIAD